MDMETKTEKSPISLLRNVVSGTMKTSSQIGSELQWHARPVFWHLRRSDQRDHGHPPRSAHSFALAIAMRIALPSS
jgi:hypothetical protein